MTPDVNVLVAAYQTGHPHHAQARQWLSEAIASCGSNGTLEILPMVAAGFLRVATNRRLFPAATATEDAIVFMKAILGVPDVLMPELGLEWTILELLCLKRGLRGDIIADAWIAAAVIANDLHLVTFDADFIELLPRDRYTLLAPESNLQEPRARYLPLAA